MENLKIFASSLNDKILKFAGSLQFYWKIYKHNS